MVPVLVVLLLLPAPADAAQHEAVRKAQQLQAAGEFSRAAELLEAHLAQHPDDGDAARLLAQTLYWMGNVPAARKVYEAAAARHAADVRLRLEFARMLAETGDAGRARTLLAPLRDVPGTRADALSLLGTLAYWGGDFTTAEQLFSEALQANPAHAEARRQLQEIRAAAAAWLKVSPAFWSDDQPLTRVSALVEAGWFPQPLTPVRVRFHPLHHVTDFERKTIWTADAEVEQTAPRLRLESTAAGGIVLREIDGSRATDWTGTAALGVRLPGHVRLRVRAQRAPYLATPDSLSTVIMTRTAAGELRLNSPRGWLGEAAVQQQRYPDANTVRTAYAWLLVPVVRKPRAEVQTGYAFAVEDSDESRFTPLGSAFGPPAPSAVGQGVEGHYSPYYTPANIVKHSVIAAVAARTATRATLRAGGSYTFHGTEDAPQLTAGSGGAQLSFAPRDLRAWDLRGSLEVTGANGMTVGIGGQIGRGNFYRWATVNVAITYKFLPRARSTGVRR